VTLRGLWRIARDQRRVLLVGVLVALAMASILLSTATRQYQASSILVVSAPGVLPAEPERPFEGPHVTNPLIRDDASLANSGQLLVADANRNLPPGSPTTVVSGTTPQFLPPTSPFITITTTGPDQAAIVRAVSLQTSEIKQHFDQYQRSIGVSAATEMTLQIVSPVSITRVGLLTSTGPSLIPAAVVLLMAILIAFARVDGLELDVSSSTTRGEERDRGRSTAMSHRAESGKNQ
jgi:hypothetical protein